MAHAFLRKEEKKTLNSQEGYLGSQISSNDEDILSSFQSIEVNEARLIEQKENLTALLSQLEIKAKEEVEKRKRKVETLNSEILDLKRKCEKLKSLISSDSTQECSQAGS